MEIQPSQISVPSHYTGFKENLYLMEVCFSPGFDEDLLVLGYSVAYWPDSYEGSNIMYKMVKIIDIIITSDETK